MPVPDRQDFQGVRLGIPDSPLDGEELARGGRMKYRLKAAYYALRGHGVIFGVYFDADNPISEDLVVVVGSSRSDGKLFIANNRNGRTFYWRRNTSLKVNKWEAK